MWLESSKCFEYQYLVLVLSQIFLIWFWPSLVHTQQKLAAVFLVHLKSTKKCSCGGDILQRAQRMPDSWRNSYAPQWLQLWSGCLLEFPVPKVRFCKVLRSVFPEVSTYHRCTSQKVASCLVIQLTWTDIAEHICSVLGKMDGDGTLEIWLKWIYLHTSKQYLGARGWKRAPCTVL